MSAIQTRQIDGDVAVGRNIAAGGDATIRGCMRVGHDLRVDGWLEARNIKGPLKGLFDSVESLEHRYPRPENGWFALVGNGLPADVYVGHDGRWVATGGNSGELRVHLVDITDRLSEVENVAGNNTTQIYAIAKELSEHLEECRSLLLTVDRLTGDLSLLREDHTTDVRTLLTKIAENVSAIERQRDTHAVDISTLSETMRKHFEAFDIHMAMYEALRQKVDYLTRSLDTLLNSEGVAGVIDTFVDVRKFLQGFDDSEVGALKRMLDSKAPVDTVTGILARLDNLTAACDSVVDSLEEHIGSDYRSVVELDEIVNDKNAAVAVEYVDDPVSLGGKVSWYAAGGFVLHATDGGWYDKWTTKWRYAGADRRPHRDVLYRCDNRLWMWDGETMVSAGASLAEGDEDGCGCAAITIEEIYALLTGGGAGDGGSCCCTPIPANELAGMLSD